LTLPIFGEIASITQPLNTPFYNLQQRLANALASQIFRCTTSRITPAAAATRTSIPKVPTLLQCHGNAIRYRHVFYWIGIDQRQKMSTADNMKQVEKNCDGHLNVEQAFKGRRLWEERTGPETVLNVIGNANRLKEPIHLHIFTFFDS
jgi:hypothetical protein